MVTNLLSGQKSVELSLMLVLEKELEKDYISREMFLGKDICIEE